ncbi:MAG: LacI family DNA-binding transcriptional regulator [Tenericutes bacterium]|nr:LacI family DNA-binding transcriptional regulator [Mycoplasmatota bacterium]
MVKNKDIAIEAGVSVATVSRVMNQSGYVKDETKNKVLEAFKALANKDKMFGQSILNRKIKIIGVVIPDISNPFFGEVIKGISRIADKYSASLLVCNTEELLEKELRYLDLFKTNNIVGLIITPKTDQVGYNSKYLYQLEDLGVPIVLLDRGINISHFNSVFVNNVSGAFDAINALISEGHKDIAIISGPMSSKPGRERFYGYENALRGNDMKVNDDFVFFGDFKLESGYEITKKILQMKNRPTAIFASNNMMALGCVKAIVESKLSIPNDIAFISFDDVEMFEIMNLNISTVSRPTQLMGEVAAEMLFELIENNQVKNTSIKEILLETKLVLRGSEKLVLK